MKRSNKILLGAATVWPIFYIFFFIAAIILMIALAPGDGPPNGMEPLLGIGFVIVMVLHFITIFGMLGLTIYYIIHAIKNEKLDSNGKIMWVVMFFFLGMITQPVYWYLNIWKEEPAEMRPWQLGEPDTASWVRPEQTRAGEYVPPSEPPDWR
jgi:hypothetical protein